MNDKKMMEKLGIEVDERMQNIYNVQKRKEEKRDTWTSAGIYLWAYIAILLGVDLFVEGFVNSVSLGTGVIIIGAYTLVRSMMIDKKTYEL